MTSDNKVASRVLAEYVETWDGGRGFPGFCVCRVIEEEGKPIRIERGKAIYLHHAPEMRDWCLVYGMARVNLMVRARPRKHK